MVARGTPNAEAVGSSPITVGQKMFFEGFIFMTSLRKKRVEIEIVVLGLEQQFQKETFWLIISLIDLHRKSQLQLPPSLLPDNKAFPPIMTFLLCLLCTCFWQFRPHSASASPPTSLSHCRATSHN